VGSLLLHGILILLLLIPWQSVKGIRLLDQAVLHDPDARASFYRSAIASQWVLAILTLAILWNADADYVRKLFTLTLSPDSLLVVGLATLAVMSQSPLIPAIRRQMERSETIRRTIYPLRNILPRTETEKSLWISVSMTAGICEEVLFRGFLFYYAQAVFGLESTGAIALSTAIFAIGHLYQGTQNMIRVAVVGAILGIVFAATQTLIFCIALHAFLDLGALFMSDFVPADEPSKPTTDMNDT
jgi:membrane protease YdiL (CAAX protease family)